MTAAGPYRPRHGWTGPDHGAAPVRGVSRRRRVRRQSSDGGPVRVRAKADLKTAKEKSDFIEKHGYAAFAKLPLNARP
jgi:hypothetical protein